MRLLLGSGGVRTEARQSLMCELMRELFGSVQRIVFVPYAMADYDRYVDRMMELGLNAGYELVGIHTFNDPARAVESAEAIYVGGGNSFRLVHELHQQSLIERIRRCVLDGMPYMGVSAGSNVACPTIMTTNDMPIIQPRSFRALDLVKFQINPHYFSGQIHVRESSGAYTEHFGETRDDRIREYHELNAMPVIGLWEGAFLNVHDGQIRLLGGAARIFRPDQPPIDLEPGAELSAQLDVAHHARS